MQIRELLREVALALRDLATIAFADTPHSAVDSETVSELSRRLFEAAGALPPDLVLSDDSRSRWRYERPRYQSDLLGLAAEIEGRLGEITHADLPVAVIKLISEIRAVMILALIAESDRADAYIENASRRYLSSFDEHGHAAFVEMSPRPVEKRPETQYEVWYGTNRRPIDPTDPMRGYSYRRDDRTHFGTCSVLIPTTHKIGSVGSGWVKRLLARQDDRLKLQSIDTLGRDQFWERMEQRVRSTEGRTGVCFVHGYNVSFTQAALRAAQLGADLGVDGAMAFFSWPSKGSPAGYFADGESVRASEGAIADFLVDFVRRSRVDRVHVIAHSMGNRGVLGAINKIRQRTESDPKLTFGQFILAAADVDADVFRQECDPYRELGRRTTLYVSARDRAVGLSAKLHDYHRIGFLPPVSIVPGIDTIAVTNVDLTLLGHGYLAEAREVLNDMHALISSDQPPKNRFGLKECRTGNGHLYWEISG